MNQESSAIAYLRSKKSNIAPTESQKLASQVKADILRGVFADHLVFPEKKKVQVRSNNFDPVKRRKTVTKIHALRSKGLTAKKACASLNVPHSSYRNWCFRLNFYFQK